jgi:hypothetical protein
MSAATLTIALAGAASADPAGAATRPPGTAAAPPGAATTRAVQATPDACKERLVRDRQAQYRFTNGRLRLTFARVVVTPTRANRHRYCVRVLTGSRTVLHAWGEQGYERKGGTWVATGGLGDTFTAKGYTQTIQVPAAYRIVRTFRIRFGARWYKTAPVSRQRL